MSSSNPIENSRTRISGDDLLRLEERREDDSISHFGTRGSNSIIDHRVRSSLNRCLGEKFLSPRLARVRRGERGRTMLITDPLITRRASSVCPAAASAMNGAHQRRITTINRTSFHQRISSVILAGCILQIKRGGMKDLY